MKVDSINIALKNHPNADKIKKLMADKGYTDKRAIPAGLMEDTFMRTKAAEKAIDIFETKDFLKKAADNAHLNVTERLALNEEFFPEGGGFELFPDNVYEHESVIYLTKQRDLLKDEFTQKILHMEVPDNVNVHRLSIEHAKEPSFQMNLKNAILKLSYALKKGV